MSVNAAKVDAVLDAIVRTIQGIGIILNGVVVPVVKRKGVKREDGVDLHTQITVCEAETGEKTKYLAFGHTALEVPVDVAILAPNDGDYLTNLPQYLAIREAVVNQFTPPQLPAGFLAGVSSVYELRVDTDQKFLDRAGQAKATTDDMHLRLLVGVVLS